MNIDTPDQPIRVSMIERLVKIPLGHFPLTKSGNEFVEHQVWIALALSCLVVSELPLQRHAQARLISSW